MLSRLMMIGVNHRATALLLLMLITLLSGLGLPELKVDTGFGNLVSPVDPDKRAYDRVAREFGSDNRTLIFLRDDALWTPDTLARIETLHYALEALPFVEQVESLFTLRSIRGNAGNLDSRALLTEAPTDPEAAARARQDALYNPLIVGNYLSKEGDATALMVTVREERDDPEFDRRVNAEFERLLTPLRENLSEAFQLGPPRINAELKSSLFEDLTLLGPASALLLVTTILVVLRSWTAALVPLVTSLLSIAWTFGVMGWMGLPINILSAMLPSLVVVIGSTEDTHLMASYFHGLHRAESQRRLFATRFMMKHMGVPMLLTVFTTSIGFASNLFSGIGLIRDFALASTLAILANGVITLLLVPALLSWFGPASGSLIHEGDRVPGLPGVVVRIFGATQRHFSAPLLLLTALMCGFFVYQASKLYVTNDPMSYFHPERPLIQQTHQVQRHLSGMKVFFITLEAEREKAFLEPENIAKLSEIQAFIEKQRIFDRSISLADHLSLINREFNGGDDEFFSPPGSRELAAQYLLFFHRNDLASYASHDYKRANIVVRHNVSDSRTLNRHIAELRQVVAEIGGPEIKAYVVGENLMINAASEDLMVGQVKSLLVLLAVIFLVMSAMFTSFKGGIIALIPNAIPIILMFGIMGFTDIPLNPGTAMVAVIAIGIAIDGTIHLFSRYNELCRHTSDYLGAVHQTVREEAVPMVATSLALALGFGVLLLSNFTLVAQFGALSAATMLFAVFANLLITPLIMARVRLIGLHQILSMKIDKAVLRDSPLFRGMSHYQMRKAILISEMHEFDAGEVVVEQGARERCMYLLLSGEMEVVRHGADGEHELARLSAGEVFGEIGYIQETERTADVRALSAVTVLRFDYTKINKDLKLFPHIVARLNFNISCILGERLADVMGRLK